MPRINTIISLIAISTLLLGASAIDFHINREPANCDDNIASLLDAAHQDQARLKSLNELLSDATSSIQSAVTQLENVCSRALLVGYNSGLFLQKEKKKTPNALLSDLKASLMTENSAPEFQQELIGKILDIQNDLTQLSDKSIGGFNAKCSNLSDKFRDLSSQVLNGISESRDLIDNYLDGRISGIQTRMEQCQNNAL